MSSHGGIVHWPQKFGWMGRNVISPNTISSVKNYNVATFCDNIFVSITSRVSVVICSLAKSSF